MSEETVTPPSEEPTPVTDENPTPSLITEGATPTEEDPAPAPADEWVPFTAEDITLPEGVTISEELRDEFLTVMNNRELSPKDQMQSLVDLQMRAAQAASEASSNAWSEMQTTWQNEVRADLGENLVPTVGRIQRLVSEYGSPELTSVFDLTGAGNNLHVIKFLDKIAGQLTEGGPATGSPAAVEASAASKLFPSMKG